MTMPRAEVLSLVERRRRWSREEKEQIVAASFEPGATASEVARRTGIHTSQLFRWRKELCERTDVAEQRLVPVEIAPAMIVAAVASEQRPPLRRRRKAGLIEIEIKDGRRLRVDRERRGWTPDSDRFRDPGPSRLNSPAPQQAHAAERLRPMAHVGPCRQRKREANPPLSMNAVSAGEIRFECRHQASGAPVLSVRSTWPSADVACGTSGRT